MGGWQALRMTLELEKIVAERVICPLAPRTESYDTKIS